MNDILFDNRHKIGSIIEKQKIVLYEFNELKLENVFDLFYILLIGFMFSIIVLIFENLKRPAIVRVNS